MEPYNSGVSYNSDLIDLACERNLLREALESIAGNLNPDDEASYRADDSEGAMDTAYATARLVLDRCGK